MKLFYRIMFLLLPSFIFAQNSFKAIVIDEKSKVPIADVTVKINNTKLVSTTNKEGYVEIYGVENGIQIIKFEIIGYTAKEKKITFPQLKILEIYLEPTVENLEEVIIVSSTRSSRNIKNIPTRIEIISGEELDEKSSMQPGNIKLLLSESTGIQTQQTSQVSGSSSIRIQGLDGKYTQLLQDGFPLYSGFAGGLSILQIPPLNLKRVEVIKGSSSTLYGGGAIAGLINLITKEPLEKREISILANVNQTNALDLSSFFAQKINTLGFTLFTSGNFQKRYDTNNDNFSDIPNFDRFTINPVVYYYPSNNNKLTVGLNAGVENRTGGDIQVIDDKADANHTFFETNKSNRFSSQIKFESNIKSNRKITFKNSVGFFNRKIIRPTLNFEGLQVSSFTEANYLILNKKVEWILGSSLVTDNFKQLNETTNKLDNYTSSLGIFCQNNYIVTDDFIIESGLRIDLTKNNKIFMLPRLSFLYKLNTEISTRFGGGLGYKNPTIFSEEAEEKAFQNINSLNFSSIKSEKSVGLNFDINYKTKILENVNLSINQLFFYTKINNPIVLNAINGSTNFDFINANGFLETKGLETNFKVKIEEISCFIGYTFTEAIRNFNNIKSTNPLTSKHRINANVMYEWEEKLRLAYEVFYVGNQTLTNNENAKQYWVMGISGEYKFKYFSLFANLENFLDARQSKTQTMYNGSIQNPQFKEVYSPTDGIIFNGGVKIKL